MATKQPELPAPNEAAPKTKRVADPELLAINNIAKCMEELDGAAQQRVVSYLNSRYSSAAKVPTFAEALAMSHRPD